MQALNDTHALGRPASSKEVAHILCLASEQGSFITGVALPVEGKVSLEY